MPIDQQERRDADAYKTKVARNKRKFACLRKNTPPPSPNGAGNSQGNINPDLYTFVTPDHIVGVI